MDIDEILSRRCAPMPEQTRLDVLFCKRFPKQRIVEEIDLTDAQIICGAPIAMHFGQLFVCERPLRLFVTSTLISALRLFVDFDSG